MSIELSEEMHDSGYKNITNIDISEVVIEKMQELYKSTKPDLKCMQVLYKLE